MPRVLIVVIDGVQTLDATGPAEVFAAAQSGGERHYQVVFGSLGGGQRVSSSGLQMYTQDLRRLRLRRDDTLLVAGAGEPEILRAMADAQLVAWLRRAA